MILATLEMRDRTRSREKILKSIFSNLQITSFPRWLVGLFLYSQQPGEIPSEILKQAY